MQLILEVQPLPLNIVTCAQMDVKVKRLQVSVYSIMCNDRVLNILSSCSASVGAIHKPTYGTASQHQMPTTVNDEQNLPALLMCVIETM